MVVLQRMRGSFAVVAEVAVRRQRTRCQWAARRWQPVCNHVDSIRAPVIVSSTRSTGEGATLIPTGGYRARRGSIRWAHAAWRTT